MMDTIADFYMELVINSQKIYSYIRSKTKTFLVTIKVTRNDRKENKLDRKESYVISLK